MNEETIAAFNTFNSLLSNAIITLHESLQETHALNAMYLDQFNDIIHFQQNTKAFTRFLKDENECQKTKYAQFKSKIDMQSTSLLLNNNLNQTAHDILSDNNNSDNNNIRTISINRSRHTNNNRNRQSINKIFQSLQASLQQNQNQQQHPTQLLSDNIELIQPKDAKLGEIEDVDDINDGGLVSNNISFNIKGQQPPIKFIEYEAPKPSLYQNIEDHPHFHPLIHGNADIEGDEGDVTSLDKQSDKQHSDINQRKVTTLDQVLSIFQSQLSNNIQVSSDLYGYRNFGKILLWLITTNNRGNNNNNNELFERLIIDLLSNIDTDDIIKICIYNQLSKLLTRDNLLQCADLKKYQIALN